MGETGFSFWMVFPFVWGGVGVLIIAVACIRELILQLRQNGQRRNR